MSVGEIPLLIVVAGCAGSGKTTLAKALAHDMNATYIDKDTLTCHYTDECLRLNGSFEGDRESDFYCDVLRPIEYSITFSLAFENIELGIDTVVSIPMISLIRDFDQWTQSEYIPDTLVPNVDYKAKFIWMIHDIGSEHDRIIMRNDQRDDYKLKHWDEYASSVEGILPDPRYNAYMFDNSKDENFECGMEEVKKWLYKR